MAKRLEDVEGLIKEELGPNAVILTTREILSPDSSLEEENQFEIVAAIDEEDLKIFQEQRGDKIHEYPQMAAPPSIASELKRIKKEILGQFNINGSSGKNEEPPLEEDKKSILKINDSSDPTLYFPELNLLVSKGVDPSVAEEIHFKLFKHIGYKDVQDPENFFNGLKKEIASLITTTGPICLSKEGPTYAALVGPAGVGKTTMLFKIAMEYVQDLNKKVALFSIDKYTMGAFEQTSMLAGHFEIPFVRIEDILQLEEEIEAYRNFDLILIDTFGCSPSQTELMQELEETFSKIDNLQVHLAISATTKDADAFNLVREFSRFLPESLMMTKMDETVSLGLLLNLCYHTHMAISYLSNGPYIPQNIKLADSDEIAHDFLIGVSPALRQF